MAQEAGEALRFLVERERATRTIETGFAFGLSALFVLEGSLGSCKPGESPRHVAVDPFQKSDWDNAGLRAIREGGVQHLVEFLREDSLLALPRLVGEGRTFDLGFVDGGHHFENAFIDAYYLHRLVKPGGLVVIDDLWMPAIQAAVSYFVRNLGSTRETLESHPAARRFAILRVPAKAPERAWDHFVEFRGITP